MKSSVEKYYLEKSGYLTQTGRVPYIVVDNFPELGLLTALRFLEWVQENPNGVISLPTGKTPEHFIRWTKLLLDSWGEFGQVMPKASSVIPAKAGTSSPRPDLSGLTFVQMDDFYPINPRQQNSFIWYVKEFYIKGLGLDPNKALLIDPPQVDEERPAKDWEDRRAHV